MTPGDNRARYAFTLTLASLIVVSLVPIWAVRYHPLPDLANHLAAAAIWVHHADPAYSRYYDIALGPNPYWGYYAIMFVFARLVGIDIANRLVLSLYVVTVPLGFAWLATRLDRDRWLALFAFPFIWSFCFNIGFIHTSLGLALVAPGLAAFDAYCDRPSPARAGLAVVLSTSIYFCHVVPWALYVGAAGLIGLLHRGGNRLWRAAVWGSGVSIGVVVTLLGRGKGMGTSHYTFAWGYDLGHPREAARVLWDLSMQAAYWSWHNCAGPETTVMLLFLGLAWLVLRATAPISRPRLHDLRAAACFLTAFLGYLLLPRSVIAPAYSWGTKYRLAAWALLFLVLLLPGAIAGMRRWLLMPAALVAVGFAVDNLDHFRDANRHADGMDEVAAHIPREARVLFLLGKPWRDPGVQQDYLQSWPAFYVAYRGGWDPWLFEDFPLRWKTHVPAPSWQAMDFTWAKHARYYDYVIGFHETAAVFGAHAREVVPVASSGAWTAWKLPGPRTEP